LGRAPRLEYDWNVVPVDHVGRAIVRLSLESDALGGTFHLANPSPLAWTRFVELIGEAGYRLRPLAYRRWRTRVLPPAADPADGRRPLRELFASVGSEGPGGGPPLYERGRMPTFDGARTARLLAGVGIAGPAAGAELARAYLSFWRDSGFLPAP